MDPVRMDYCTSASGAARWRNVRGDRDNGTDSDVLPLSLLWRDVPQGHPQPGAPRARERESSDSGIDSEELSPSLPTRSFKLCRCRID